MRFLIVLILLSIWLASSGQIKAYRDGQCFYLFKNEVPVSDCYKLIETISENNYLIITSNDKYGVIDNSSHLVIDTLFTFLAPINGHGFIYSKGRETLIGLLDANGNELTSAIYSDYIIGDTYISVKDKNNLWGLITHDGAVVVKPQYQELWEDICPIEVLSSQTVLYYNNTSQHAKYGAVIFDLDRKRKLEFGVEVPRLTTRMTARHVFIKGGKKHVVDSFGEIRLSFPKNWDVKVDDIGFTYVCDGNKMDIYNPSNAKEKTIRDVMHADVAGKDRVIVRMKQGTALIGQFGNVIHESQGTMNLTRNKHVVVTEGKFNQLVDDTGGLVAAKTTHAIIESFKELNCFVASDGDKLYLYDYKMGKRITPNGFTGYRKTATGDLKLYYYKYGPFDYYSQEGLMVKEEASYVFDKEHRLINAYTKQPCTQLQFRHIIRYNNDSMVLAAYNAGYPKLANYDYYLINMNDISLMDHFDEVYTHSNHDWMGDARFIDTTLYGTEFVVEKEGKYGLIDKHGSYALEANYDSIAGIKNIHIAYKNKTLDVFTGVDKTKSYKRASLDIQKDYLVVSSGSKKHIYDNKSLVIEGVAITSYANLFSGDLYYEVEGKHFLFKKDEQSINEVKYKVSASIQREYGPCLYMIKRRNKLGVMDHNLKVLVKPSMDEIYLDDDNMLYMIRNGQIVNRRVD